MEWTNRPTQTWPNDWSLPVQTIATEGITLSRVYESTPQEENPFFYEPEPEPEPEREHFSHQGAGGCTGCARPHRLNTIITHRVLVFGHIYRGTEVILTIPQEPIQEIPNFEYEEPTVIPFPLRLIHMLPRPPPNNRVLSNGTGPYGPVPM